MFYFNVGGLLIIACVTIAGIIRVFLKSKHGALR